MKNILIVVDDLQIGGVQRVTSIISDCLSREFNVTLFSTDSKSSFFPISSKVIYGKKNRINSALNLIFRGINKIYRGLTHKHKNIINRLDSNFVNLVNEEKYDTVIFSGCWGILQGKLFKKKFPDLELILWMHSSFEAYFDNYFESKREQLIESIQSSDKIVVLNDEIKRKYEKFTQKVYEIPNPLTIETKGEKSDLNNHIISFTSRIVVHPKGLDYLVKIAQGIPDNWKISVAGTGSNEEVKEFVSLIKEAGMGNKIILKGALNGKELVQHYLESSIFILTSRWEGFGLVLTEAMSLGLPIVSFACSGPAEILEKGKDGILVEQDNVDEFGKKLSLLIESKGLRESYSKKSIKRAKDFSVETIVKQWKEVLW